MEILALGAGVQSTALAIMNAEGQIQPRAEYAVFSNTGGELPETYEHLCRLSRWLGRRLPLVVVEKQPPLADVKFHYPVLPVHADCSLLPRRCTDHWKVRPMHRWARGMGIKNLTVQLGISCDESQRIKEAPQKWVTRRWPLIDRLMNREDCRRVIAGAGLPIPTKSACFFCPLRSQSWWRFLKARWPHLFKRACEIEEGLPNQPGKPIYTLSGTGRLLRDRLPEVQSELGLETVECEGICFT